MAPASLHSAGRVDPIGADIDSMPSRRRSEGAKPSH